MKDSSLSKVMTGSGITHNGTFHADDVFSTCLLKKINRNFHCNRMASVPENYSGIVYDIGGGEFDHHTASIKKRSNGKPYAAFGLLWKEFGTYFMSQEKSDLFDRAFITEIDWCDTTSNTNLLSSCVGSFNPLWNEEQNSDAAFSRAVDIFYPVISQLIEHFKTSTFVPRYCKTIYDDIAIALKNICKEKGVYLTHQPSDLFYAWRNTYQDILLSPELELTERESFVKSFLSQVGSTYGPLKTSPFVLAVSVMKRAERINLLEEIIRHKLSYINSLADAKKECEHIYQESERKDILIFNRYIPSAKLSDSHPDVKAVAFPTDRGGYNIMPLEMSGLEKLSSGLELQKSCKRFYFPSEWCGRTREELSRFHKGLFFVHPSGHLASCLEKKDIEEIFDLAVNH